MFKKFIMPIVHSFECSTNINIINKNTTIRPPVECTTKALEPLLTCSVPNLPCKTDN